MNQHIAQVTFLVRDYDVAIEFFTQALGFAVVEDVPLGGGKRWVLVSPPGSSGIRLLLAKAVTPEQDAAVGRQGGGRVFLFLHTDDFWRDFRRMVSRGVKFAGEPREETYGTVAVFADLYGNNWDLLERKGPEPTSGVASRSP